MKCSIDSTVNGHENLIRNEKKYDNFSVDLSEDGDGKCTTIKSLGSFVKTRLGYYDVTARLILLMICLVIFLLLFTICCMIFVIC